MLTRTVSFLLILFFCAAISAPAAPLIAGYSPDEALRLGEAMYREGVLPSGKPMTAIVQGDIELTGRMITCSNCHMRSGLGSAEGNVLSLPTNGARLYAPIQSMRDVPGMGMAKFFFQYKRPEYTDPSLVAALRHGVDPTGRVMLDTMPRYVLDNADMELMIYYLKNLSSELSPGVAGNVIRFATIVTDEVSAEDRRALLEPLMSYVRDEWNANVPVMIQAQRDSSYRTVSFDVWELTGPPDTWGGQLEAFYRKQPVFALLGGMTTKGWGPVHRFSEKNRIPCVFPITDLPQAPGQDWYTLYFSKGYYQEGEAAAKYLARVLAIPQDKPVVQVFRERDEGKALSLGFSDTWKKLGAAPLKNRVISPKEKIGAEFWKGLAAAHRNAVFLLWLGPEDLAGLGSLGGVTEKPSMIFMSSTMLAVAPPYFSSPLPSAGEGRVRGGLEVGEGQNMDQGNRVAVHPLHPRQRGTNADTVGSVHTHAITDGSLHIPDALRDVTYLTWPNRLPDDQGRVPDIVEQWLKAKRISSDNLSVSSKVYFLTRMVSNALSIMRGDAYRDYFLDLFDIQEDQSFNVVAYPRLSFGPGQRYASKGCYIVTLTKGEQPKVVKQSEWVVY